MTTKNVFITGSGTGVGKTFISKLLLKNYSDLGCRVTYMKPVETGCEESPDGEILMGPDTASALKLASCQADDINLHSPYRFAPACSPHLAAKNSHREISIDHIVLTYENLIKTTSADITIVEGAGGLLVPINDRNQYIADVIKALAIPAILVVTPQLGTLNHTFMSLRMLEQYGIPAAGIIINNAGNVQRDFIYEDNVETIRRYAGAIPCLDIDYNDTLSELSPSNKQLLTEMFNETALRH